MTQLRKGKRNRTYAHVTKKEQQIRKKIWQKINKEITTLTEVPILSPAETLKLRQLVDIFEKIKEDVRLDITMQADKEEEDESTENLFE